MKFLYKTKDGKQSMNVHIKTYYIDIDKHTKGQSLFQ